MAQPLKSLQLVCLVYLMAASLPSVAADATMLKPPAGAKVAVVVFEDLAAPECAHAYPLVWDAAVAHKVPVMLFDFPLPRHNWAFEAAIWARYFDQTSTDLGNAFRKLIYANQAQITRETLQQWVQKFGDENQATVILPNDPSGQLAEKVKADFALGQRLGVEHSLTLWVVSNSGVSQPLVEEVKDRKQLNQMIEEMLKKAQSTSGKNISPKGAAPKKSLAKNMKKAG
jgi:protein-disulfide isomerase